MTSPARKLTTHQKAVLIQVLLAFPEQAVAIQYVPSAADSPSYAQDFLTIFKAVGWTVGDAEPTQRFSKQAAGLALIVSEDHRLPPGAEAFRDALRIYGIEMEMICDPGAKIAENSFVLSIAPDHAVSAPQT
jgi:hypothetical protein